MAITRINNNQITDSVSGNIYLGVNAAVKVQDYSITAGKIQNNLTYGSDLTITGNLTVQGNTTAIDTVNLVVEDPLILLAKEQTGAPALDIGFIGKRGTDENIAFVWDESADQFVAVFTNSEVTNSVININSYASLQVLDLTAANANITGNVTFSGNIVGNLTVTGNVDANNFNATSAVTAGTTITATGNVTGGNITTAGVVEATGNVIGGNLTTGGEVVATGNVTGGNVSAGSGTIVTTGNIDGGNVNATANVTGQGAVFSGNVTADTFIGNIQGNIDAGGANTNIQFNDDDVLAGSAAFTFDKTSNLVTATGNISAGNLITGGVVSATGNVSGGNITTGGAVDATGDVTGGNLITLGDMQSNTIHTTGNAVIGGNLIVQGNITYINIDDLRVEDPIIIMGTGANGAPPVADDGQDRGIFMEYYSTAWSNAFVGWERSSNSIFAATSVEFSANNVVNVLEYGPFTAGNANLQSANVSGNVSGGNITTAGLVEATGNVTGGNITTAGVVEATGNVIGGNLTTAGVVEATGNVSGGNITTAGLVEATGNVTGGNITTANVVQATGNVIGGNITTAGVVEATGNVIGGNLTTAGVVEATGNVSGGNITTAGVVEATGNVTGGNIVTTGTADLGNIRITGDDITNFASNIITINTAGSDIDFRVSGDTVANLLLTDAGTDTVVIGGGNATVGAALKVDTTDSMMPPVGNTAQRPGTPEIGMIRFSTSNDSLEQYASTGWETVGTQFTVITADAFVGNGVQTVFTLSEDSTTAATIVAINGVVQEPTTAYSVSGNVLTFTEAPAVSDNIDARLLTTTTTVTSITNISGNAVVAVLDSADTVQITGNLLPVSSNTYDLGSGSLRWNELFLQGSTITLGNVVIKNTAGNTIGFFGPDGTTPGAIDSNNIDSAGISNGTSSMQVIASGGNIRANVGGAAIAVFHAGGIDNGQANGVGNIGTATSYFNTIFAQATSAQYADLAEMYEADAMYEPGTVLCFGGAKEVTLCGQADSTRVAGVVSTNPSYLMNSGQTGDNVVAVALTGRVPCKVTGTIRKGDLIVSTGDGRGRANNAARVGTVIGKALADFDGTDGVIEVVVGRV